nr:immunoglobulin heavy chain junction region [Macaca mulatta]MOX59146.1 immunoglobulin heavy chain junction region [Macaca mulatta]MOX59519.1 immunoglobulin heavy chain junction region [Macaca mulatta]MOX60001.1 immunoglobulin heavy chain junction region [Macaca mulatta]MOX62154.1 immunoglobulin heavy chain junction region [Macaca mulatta]
CAIQGNSQFDYW